MRFLLAVVLGASFLFSSPVIEDEQVTGVVLDASGSPVEGATVVLYAGMHRPQLRRTDASGRFVFDSPSSEGLVSVAAKGFAPRTAPGITAGADASIVLSAGSRLAGTVVDGVSGEPIAGARVETRTLRTAARAPLELPSFGLALDETDDDGRFTLHDLPDGPLRVQAGASGFASRELDTDDTLSDLTFRLEEGVGISGRIVDEQGRAVEGAVVGVVPARQLFTNPNGIDLMTTSDSSGHFQLYGVPLGTHDLAVGHPDFTMQIVPGVLVEPGSDAHVDVEMTRGARVLGRLVGEDGEPLTGDVTLALEALAVAGAIRAPMTVRAAMDGTFELYPVPIGEHELVLSPEGYLDKSEPIYIPDASETALGDVVFPTGLTISGTVVDFTGDVIPGARVQASLPDSARLVSGFVPKGAVAQSGEEGRFLIAGLDEGPITLTAILKGYSAPRPVSFEAGTRDALIVLERGATLAGRVLDESREPISDFEVFLSHPSAGGTTGQSRQVSNADGRFEIAGLAPNTYVVTVSARHLKPESVTRIEVEAGRVTSLPDFILGKGGAIRGVVVDPDGEAVTGATLMIQRDAMRRLTAVSSSESDGRFAIGGLEDGVHDVRAFHPDFSDAILVDVEVRQGKGPTDVKVRLSRGGTLGGIVRSREPLSEEGRFVRAIARGSRSYDAAAHRVGPSGRFVIERVEVGSVQVELLTKTGLSETVLQRKEASIREGETTYVEFDSSPVKLSGYVRRGGVSLKNVHLSLQSLDSVGGRGGTYIGSGAPPTKILPLQAFTGDDGFYQLFVDRPGHYRVRARLPEGNFVALPERIIDVPDVIEHVVDFDYDAVTVHGFLRAREDGAPIGGTIVAMRTDGTDSRRSFARSKEDGSFRLELEPGEYRLSASADHYAAKETGLRVESVSGMDIEILLESGAVIRGRVADELGRPPGRFYARAVEDRRPTTEAPRHGHWAEVHPDGVFEIRDLHEGRFNVLVGSDLLGFAAFAGVGTGSDALTVRLRAGVFVDLLVVDTEGAPVPSARYALSGIRGRRYRGPGGVTDESGRARVFVPADEIEIKAVKGELQGTVRLLADGETRAVVRLAQRP